jgi:hypothetical protein
MWVLDPTTKFNNKVVEYAISHCCSECRGTLEESEVPAEVATFTHTRRFVHHLHLLLL